MASARALHIPRSQGGFDIDSAVVAVSQSDLPRALTQEAKGHFGRSSEATRILEVLAAATDLGLAAASGLRGVILQEAGVGETFAMPELSKEQTQLVGAFQLTVTATDAIHALETMCPTPSIEAGLDLDGVEDLLAESEPSVLAARFVNIAAGYLRTQQPPKGAASDYARYAGTTLIAAMKLLSDAVQTFAKNSAIRALVKVLERYDIRIGGVQYDGLRPVAAQEKSTGLMPITVDDIVGNEPYIEAGLRLARNVAAYDFELGRNPKKLNPVLFGLGSPGCGKTITAHAVANYFLEYCSKRNVPAKFVVVRRSDWASSYQNASAANLIRIFQEEVYGFEGVAGVYWPDIDTALASRSSPDLRMEEKQNLGAVFGVFDGTLLPKDGKWFMMCDANTMHMDEAAVSRIAQNPITVEGPVTEEDYVRLMRDICLRDVRSCVPSDDGSWERIGQALQDHKVSGREVNSIAGNVRVHIQDFELPDRYFSAPSEERANILSSLNRPVDAGFILREIDDLVEFKREAREREEQSRFEAEVESVVRQLNAGRAALERVPDSE